MEEEDEKEEESLGRNDRASLLPVAIDGRLPVF
jgi:hypothetical protein